EPWPHPETAGDRTAPPRPCPIAIMLECSCMRTTVEIRDDQHAALAALASKRGVRGFSRLVEEAIDLYLAEQRRDRLDEALGLEGALSEKQAQELERRIAE